MSYDDYKFWASVFHTTMFQLLLLVGLFLLFGSTVGGVTALLLSAINFWLRLNP